MLCLAQNSGGSSIFILTISNGGKILNNINLVVRGQSERENNSLPVAVHVSKTRVLNMVPDDRSARETLLSPRLSAYGGAMYEE